MDFRSLSWPPFPGRDLLSGSLFIKRDLGAFYFSELSKYDDDDDDIFTGKRRDYF